MDMQQRDLRHLWHPYTDMTAFAREPYLCVTGAQGVHLHTLDGRKLIDGIASWWCVNLGHGHPAIVNAIQQQAAVLQHAMIGGMSHVPAIELAERLAARAPGDLNRVYYGADGSSVVEAALKMAVQYWKIQGRPEKARFIALENAYHGDTIGAMEAGCISWFADTYGAMLTPALQAPTPHYPGPEGAEADARLHQALAGLEELLERHHATTAAVILEPLVQGAAGVRIYKPEYLAAARRLCDAFGVLLILDEVATGCWRTGKPFAADHAAIVPDILCLGKGLTGGTLPLSALVATEAVYAVFTPPAGGQVFWDGHTFCGNPITCAAALAALDAYETLEESGALPPRIQELDRAFAQLGKHPAVAYTRTCGLVAMLSLKAGAPAAKALTARAIETGLYIRPLGDVVYLWPPLTITQAELHQTIQILTTSLNATPNR